MVRLFSDVASRVADPYLRRAASLALRGQGTTAPNPMVGCVVVNDGRIVGEGFHRRAGGPHAEVLALADAGELASGADAYVTLEPCSHHGRTPPCTDALVAAGVRRVVIGMADPTELAGGGSRVLRSAGIDVEFADDPAPFIEMNRGWMKRTATGLPFVTVKVGMSLDARVALTAGKRASMTGRSGASVTRSLRSRSDAVLVGASTVSIDDPSLTVRDSGDVLAPVQPLRVVLAGAQEPHSEARVFTDRSARTLVLVPEGSQWSAGDGVDDLREISVSVVRLAANTGLRGALAALGEQGVNEVLVEPGPRLFSALWMAGEIDELVTVSAGGIAGAGAPSLSDAMGLDEVASVAGAGSSLSHTFSPVEAGIVGDVAVTIWRPSDAVER